jgi:nucleoside-diphosphate-sugar epimerase
MNQRTTIVTGGAGRIGRHLLDHLSVQGPVLSLDQVPTEGHPHCILDVENIDALVDSIPEGSDIVHLAALDFDTNSTDKEFLGVNISGTWNILRAAELVRARRVVVFSSLAATGLHIRNGKPLAKIPVDESVSCEAKDAYGAGKLAVEAISKAFSERGLIEVTLLRPASVLFPGSLDTFINETNSRPNFFDYVAIHELVRAIELALVSEQAFATPTFIVAGDTACEEPTLVWYLRAFGHLPLSVQTSAFQKFPRTSVFSNELARQRFSWTSTTDFLEVLSKTYVTPI